MAALLGLGLIAAHGATVISLDATDKPLGPLDPWPNTGTVAGDFNAAATGLFVPAEVVLVDGVKGVAIPASATGISGSAYDGPFAPDSMCGGANRTIEAWVWDPQLQNEKTVVSWGHRGGAPDGSNCTFGHGIHPVYGFFGGWAYADLGDTNNPTTVVPNRWTYVAYTYDSATRTARIYQDGVEINVESYPTQPLATWTNDIGGNPIPFRVGRQTDASGVPSNTGLGTNVLGRIRISDIVLTSLQISNQFQAEKSQFMLADSDGDGIPDWWEIRNGFNPNLASDGASDPDADGSSNLQEFQRNTLPLVADTDGDGVKDGAETKTGTFVNANDRGTDPLNPDSDGDSLLDGVETGTGVFASAADTGSNPNQRDTDGDTWDDGGEVLLGSNPNLASSIPTAVSWAVAVTQSNPKYWYRFEETDPSQTATNSGSATEWQGAYGPGIVAANLGLPSALPSLGSCLQFTGPAADNTTTKYVDMAAVYPAGTPTGGPEIPELVNYRTAPTDKTTTVEYWFKTTQVGTHGGNSWQSPSIMAHESPGDGDMYWGKINNTGEFGFSTSDNNDILTKRDMGKNCTDGNWHHLVMIKEWHQSAPNISRMYLDGGPLQPNGASFTKTLGAGTGINYQDLDSFIQYIGFTQSGELENVQYIGYLDEVVIYDRALTEAEVRLHSQAVLGADTDNDGMPDVYELNHGLNPNSAADASADPDNDGLTNLQEYVLGTDPQVADTDSDGVKDGAETGTGVWVNVNDRGTDPFNPDTDSDGLADGIEDNTGTYVDATHTGTSPLKRDTDGDGYSDPDEIALGSNPNQAGSQPAIPTTYAAAVQADNPVHWLRFEETTTAGGAVNQGSLAASFSVVYGPGILDADLGKPSASAKLGQALEFTGPAAGTTTTKYVDFGQPIPELVNLRDTGTGMEEGKATTVEYWFQTTINGSNGNDTWRNPSLLAHESGGDGDMYWGNFNQDGDFIFSTSDLHDAHVTNRYATDGTWHHVVMVKIWHTNSPCVTRLFMDGGASLGGKTIETTTSPGNASGQDSDGQLQYLGFTETGDASNAQFIGRLDEFAVYTNAFLEAQARVHYLAGGGQPHTPGSLQYSRSGNDLVLTWSTGTLVAADEVNGTYQPVPGASSPYTVTPTGNRKFFRVRLP